MNSEPGKTVWKRNKTIAVLLAVFFGPWTWLYTYRRDPGKAAFGLGLNISQVTIFALMVIQSKLSPPPADLYDGGGLFFSAMGLLTFLFVTWVLAITFSATTKEYYLYRTIERDKSVAILLAILLGPWTWLYTYKQDYRKFWPAISIGLGGWGAWALLPEEISKMIHPLWLPICLFIWIVAIISSILRKSEWYKTFAG